MDNEKYRDPQDRYLHDSEYHAMVDAYEAILYEGRHTPNELLEAIALATIHFEMRRSRGDSIISQEEMEYRWRNKGQPRKYIIVDECGGTVDRCWDIVKGKGGKT